MRIFDRSRHGAALTGMGRAVVVEAESLLKQSAILDHNLRLLGLGELGTVAFGMWPLLGSMILAELSSFIVRERPRLAVRASPFGPARLSPVVRRGTVPDPRRFPGGRRVHL